MGERLEASIPADAAIRGKTLVILSSAGGADDVPPVDGAPGARRPAPPPHAASWPRASTTLRVSRLDATTLRIRPEKGFLDNELLRMVRGLSRPFHAGDEVVLSDMRVRVREVTADGRPAEVDFTFARPARGRVPPVDAAAGRRRARALVAARRGREPGAAVDRPAVGGAEACAWFREALLEEPLEERRPAERAVPGHAVFGGVTLDRKGCRWSSSSCGRTAVSYEARTDNMSRSATALTSDSFSVRRALAWPEAWTNSTSSPSGA